MMKKIIFTLCIASGIWGLAKMNKPGSTPIVLEDTTWEEISITEYENSLKKTAAFYNQLNNFSVRISHASYKGHESFAPHEKMNGSFIRSANNYRSVIMNILTIQNEQAKIIVDTLGKTIMVAEPDEFKTNEAVSIDYLLSAKNIKKIAQKKASNGIRFKLEFTSGRYDACEVLINEEGALQEIVFLFRDKFRADPKNEDSPLISPKAIISYSDLIKNPNTNTDDFDLSKFIKLENNTPTGVNGFKNYRIIDTRLNQELLKK